MQCAGRERRPRRRARAGPAVYTVARAASCTQAASWLERSGHRRRREVSPSPAAARPLHPSRAQQVKRPGCQPRCRRAGKLGIRGLVSLPWAAVGCVTCVRRLGILAPKGPLSGSRSPRASVSASMQWGGPSASRLEGRMPGRPAPPSCAASGGPGSDVLPGGAHRAGARDRQPRAATARPGCPLQKRRWRRAPSPPGPASPRTCERPETGLMMGRGGSPEQELARAGRGRLPTCPRPAQVRPRAAARTPPGPRSVLEWPWGAFRPVAGRGESRCQPHSAHTGPWGAPGWGSCSGWLPGCVNRFVDR